jgi:hypothetical protein
MFLSLMIQLLLLMVSIDSPLTFDSFMEEIYVEMENSVKASRASRIQINTKSVSFGVIGCP